jgi:membrane-associated HD superfamily phosphohydrolase
MNTNTFNQAFFANQSQQTAGIQDLMKQAQQTLACGPECQRLQNIENLKQKYINAQTNVISAPDQLLESQKNFFIASQGVSEYNTMIESELTTKSTKIADVMDTEFNNNINEANSLTQTYNTLEQQEEYLYDLKNKYIKENDILTKKINYIFNDIVTNDRKTYYQIQNMSNVNAWYSLYKVVYIILLVIFFIFIFAVNSNYSFKVKAFIFLLFLIYPWVAGFFIFRIIAFFQHVASLLPKNIYKDL